MYNFVIATFILNKNEKIYFENKLSYLRMKFDRER